MRSSVAAVFLAGVGLGEAVGFGVGEGVGVGAAVGFGVAAAAGSADDVVGAAIVALGELAEPESCAKAVKLTSELNRDNDNSSDSGDGDIEFERMQDPPGREVSVT